MIHGPTINVTINFVLQDYTPPFKPIFVPDLTLLDSQNVTLNFDSFVYLIDLAETNTGTALFELPDAVSPSDLSMVVDIKPKIFDRFISYDASATTFVFDLDILN